jgi:hypothetical protein
MGAGSHSRWMGSQEEPPSALSAERRNFEFRCEGLGFREQRKRESRLSQNASSFYTNNSLTAMTVRQIDCRMSGLALGEC